MNEETKNDPKPERVYPYEQWWREACREIDGLKEKLANSTALLALAVVELRKLQEKS